LLRWIIQQFRLSYPKLNMLTAITKERMKIVRKETAMVGQTLTLAELQSSSLEQIFQDVADQQLIVTVLLPDGREVVIEPKPSLQPLPELEGRVPEGWKDAVYARS
jgi:hypothetical protein